MGSYQCAVFSGEDEILSIEGYIELEGLPHFSVEPQHRSVVANEELSLRCVAHGPPDPVWVIWLQVGAPLNNLGDLISLSPSTLNISGLHFVESPMNVTSSLGKPVAVRCVLRADGEGQGPLDVLWLKEGQPLDFADTNQMQFPEDENGWLVISKLK